MIDPEITASPIKGRSPMGLAVVSGEVLNIVRSLDDARFNPRGEMRLYEGTDGQYWQSVQAGAPVDYHA